jgi:hypothetical protein
LFRLALIRQDRRRSCWGAAALLLIVQSTWTASAGAQTAAERETARRLMDRGDEQADRADFVAALASYRAAHAIMRVPTTGIEVAKTLEKLHAFVEARDAAIEVLRMPAAANEPQPFQNARASAAELTAALRDRIPALTVEITPPEAASQAALSVDEQRVPSAALGQPYFLNPGAHRLSLSAPRYRSVELNVELTAGEQRTVRLALQPSIADVPSPETSRSPGTRAKAPEPPATLAAPPSTRSLGWPVWASLGVTVTGALVGTISGVLSLQHAKDANAHCQGNTCSPEARSDRDAALAAARASNIGWAVAGAGVALTVTAWWLTKSSRQAQPAKLSVAMTATGGEIRLSGAVF